MERKTFICTVILILSVLLVSCEKLEDTQSRSSGVLKMEFATLDKPIPLAWGNIISVSSTPPWVQLWFQDKDGTVYMIPYNVESNKFESRYRYIMRK